MWLIGFESLASLIWVVAIAAALVIAAVSGLLGDEWDAFGFAMAWGIAIAIVATVQLVVAMRLDHAHDRLLLRAFLLGPLYPLAYWMISAAAALREQVIALVRGPRGERVVWDIPRERIRAG
jgi:hypothetical protein